MFFRLIKSGQQGLLSRTLKALNSTLPRFYGHQHQIQSRFCRSDNFLHVSRTYPNFCILWFYLNALCIQATRLGIALRGVGGAARERAQQHVQQVEEDAEWPTGP